MSRESEYWAERWVQVEDANHRTAEETMSFVDEAYRRAEREVEGQLSTWYQRFADNNGIVDMAEARRLLNSNELAELRWTLDDYIKHGQENGVLADWTRELENASAKYHITRLEALRLNIQQSCEVLYGNTLDHMDDMMRQTYLGSYYHTAFTIQTGAGIGWNIAALNQRAIQTAVNKPWTVDGRNFSDRLWSNRGALIQELQKNLTQSLMTGNTCEQTIQALMNRFHVSRNQAARLVFTENAYIQAVAQGDSYRTNGVKKYQFIATLDDRTSDICREMDGKVFDIKDYNPGETVPPLHPWCRSCTAPYFESLAGIGERAARNPETGKTYYVPRSMKYEDWKKTFVDGGDKNSLLPAAPRNYNSTFATTLGKKAYDECRDILAQCHSPEAQAVWDSYEADIRVADLNEGKRAHCDWNNAIHFDLKSDSTGSTWEKPYQVTFHESGHAIDMIAGRRYGYDGGSGYNSPRSLFSLNYKNGLFPKTIRDEVDTLVSVKNRELKTLWNNHAGDWEWLTNNGLIERWTYDFYKNYGFWPNGEPSYTKAIAYKAIESEIRKLNPFQKADLSDILEGATREKIQIGWGHGNRYWKNGNWTLATEAFAEMYDSTVANTDSMDTIKQYLPKSYDVFLDMLKAIIV